MRVRPQADEHMNIIHIKKRGQYCKMQIPSQLFWPFFDVNGIKYQIYSNRGTQCQDQTVKGWLFSN